MPNRHGSDGESHRYGFQNQEKDDEVYNSEGTYINYKYRGADTRIGRFFAVDPLARDFSWNSPYAFSENRVIDGVELEGLEVKLTRPDGSTRSGPYSNQYIQDGISNGTITNVTVARQTIMLSEFTVLGAYNGNTLNKHVNQYKLGTWSYWGQPGVTTYGNTKGWAGFMVGTDFKSKYLKANVGLTGFSASASNYTGTGKKNMAVVMKAEVSALKGDAGIELGGENWNAHGKAEGALLSADAELKAGILTGENGETGFIAKAGAGAYLAEGEVTGGFTLFGVRFGVTVGGSAGSAHIGGEAGYVKDKNGGRKTSLKGHIGLGVGLKFGFSVSTVKSKKKRHNLNGETPDTPSID